MKYEFGEFCFDADAGRLLKDGVEVPINKKAATILRILIEDGGSVVKKDDIIEEVWSDSFVEESNLTQHIYTLRKALGQTTSQITYIETVPKTGYRFRVRVNPVLENGNGNGNGHDVTNGNGKSARVEHARAEDPAASASPEESSTLVQIDDRPDRPTSDSRTARPRIRMMWLVLIGCVVTGIAIAGFYRMSGLSNASPDRPVKSIAVLPFRSLNGADDSDKLGLGMADAVITKLGKLQQIQVRPTSSVFDLASKQDVNPVFAGQNLRVDTVLDGTVQREEGKVRVTVQLISVSDERTLWSESFNEGYADVFKVQDVIAERVARALTLNLDETQRRVLQDRATSSMDAYKAYLLGIYFWNTRGQEGLQKGIDHFKQAIELDPRYAYAYAGLADSYAMMGYYRFADPAEMFPLARQTATHALTLDGSVAEAYIALAQVQKHFEHDNDASRRSLERAIELAPYNATARQRYAWQLVADKNFQPALSEMRLAHEYDPVSPSINTALCQVLSYRREHHEALPYCKNASEIAPDSSVHQLEYADVLFFSGQSDAAIAKLQNAVQKNEKDHTSLIHLAYFYAKTGKREESLSIFRSLRSVTSDDSRRFIHLANIALALSEKKESYRLLKQAVDSCAIPFDAEYDPLFDDLRSDDLLKRTFAEYQCANPAT